MSTPDRKHPYQSLPPRNFWRPSVSQINPFAMSELYLKKFDIKKTDSIATAGSCFAQHIAKHLAKSGFNYRDFEPAMNGFPEDRLSAYNYGVYSARYCNIYTARQLLQTFQRALGELTPREEFWVTDEGVYDQFRPILEPKPFVSVEEARAARESHYAALKRLLAETDVFIFTFGLTEAWRDRRDGTILPVCPGTQAGEFSADHHEFVNFSTSETISDFREFMKLCRSIRNDMRFLLTVSPVPLVATASENHVLVATTYSKSSLRAAAGELAASDEGTAYFPSYEIVSTPPFRGSFFEPDMRSVTPWGVRYVMSHFFQVHDPQGNQPSGTDLSKEPERKAVASHAVDLICEEMLLDKFVP